MAIPTIVNVGTKGAGTGNVTPGLPASIQADDILLLYAETNTDTTISVDQGFAELPDSPQSALTVTQLHVYWKRAGASEAAPTVTQGGTTNHVCAGIIAIRGCVTTGDPWDVTAGGADTTSDTTCECATDTSTVDDCLVLFAGSFATDTNAAQGDALTSAGNLANAALTALNYGTNAGGGGGVVVCKGEKATAGAFGTLQFTTIGTNRNGVHTIALKPVSSTGHTQPADDTASVTDAHAKAAGATKADPATVTDAQARIWAAERTQPDTASVTDAVAKASTLTLADALSVTDAQAKETTTAQADTASVTDAQSRVWVAERTQSDSASITDAAETQTGGGANDFTQPVDDTASVTDALAKALTLSLADTAGVTDALASERAFTRVISDTAAVTDAINTGGSSAYTEAVDDALAATDAVGKALTLTFADSLAATDAIAGKAITQAHAEQLAATDTLVREAAVLRSLADTLTVTDETARALGSARWNVDTEARWADAVQSRWPEDTDNDWATTSEENW